MNTQIPLALGLTLFLSQIIKVIVYGIMHRFDPLIFFMDGGFPSSHSALMSSLTTIILIEQGASMLFFAILVLTIIIVNDSFRVRRQTGKGAKIINALIKKEQLNFDMLSEKEGHTFGQTMAGVAFGIIVTLVVYSL